MRMPALMLLSVLLSANAMAKDAAGLFDKPVKVVKVPLPADPLNPSSQACGLLLLFQRLCRQTDRPRRGRGGAFHLSAAAGGEAYKCREAAAAGELAVDAKEWYGYFKGAKGSYVFFDSGDGHNGGTSFAIFSAPDAKKLVEETALSLHAIELKPSGLRLRYTRVYEAGCSLYADPAGCWAKVKQNTGLTQASPPDCAASYKAEEKRMKGTPNQAKVASLPSVVDYEAETVLQGGQSEISAAQGKVDCRRTDWRGGR